MKMIEVICSGLNVVDLLVSVPPHVPKGQKTACDKILIQGGAPAGNAACALARLGHTTGMLGYLGDNTLSAIAKTELEKHGVSTALFKQKKEATPAIAIVQIDAAGERTVLYSMEGYTPFALSDIDEMSIAQAKLILVDGYDITVNTALLRMAQKYQINTVLDLETSAPAAMKEMLSLATDAILPLEAAQMLTGKQTAEDCLFHLTDISKGQLVITDGANGAYALDNENIIHQEAFSVSVVDTTGCGDSFHAAYASALLQGFKLTERLVYASFYAAQVAQHFGGRTFLPDRNYMKVNCPAISTHK